MRGIFFSLPFCFAMTCAAVFAAEAGADPAPPPDFDSRILARIEEACGIGVGKAASEEEVLLSLRWRNGALAALVEITYEATLAWLAGSPGKAEKLEVEQGAWLTTLNAGAAGTRDELDGRAAALRRRLEELAAMTER